jgi:hypothetical protein
MPHWANEHEWIWFTETQIAEAVTAQQLYCLIEPRQPSLELGAQAFTRAFTALPFSPLLYGVLLTRLLKGQGSTP